MSTVPPITRTKVGEPTAATAAYSPAPFASMELRELRSFAIAARTGNIGRAARQLGVTAAAVSQQLHKLEAALAVRLLIRHSRGVSTTPAGRELLRRADVILRLVGAPLDNTPLAAASSTISVALPTEFGPLLAAPLVAAARCCLPHATLAIVDSNDGALADICGGPLDIALLQDAPKLEELLVDRLLTEDLVFVSAPDHPLADGVQPLRLRELVTAPLILPAPGHWIRRLLAKAEARRSVRLTTITQVDSVPVILAMVHEGLGCAVLPAAAISAHAVAGAVAFRAVAHPSLAVTHAIAVRRDAAPAVIAFAAHAAGVIRAAAAGGAWPGARLLQPTAPPLAAAAAGRTVGPGVPTTPHFGSGHRRLTL